MAHPGQNGVRQRVAEEGHGSQNHVAAQNRTYHAHDHRGDEGLLHEPQRQGIGEPAHQDRPFPVPRCRPDPGRPRPGASSSLEEEPASPWAPPLGAAVAVGASAAALIHHDGLAVHHHHLTAEGLAQMFGREYLGRGSGADEPPVEKHHLLKPARRQVQIVGGDEELSPNGFAAR